MDIPTLEDQEYYYGVGRRKTASAQVRLYPTGDGKVVVNEKPMDEYFPRVRDRVHIMEPLQATDTEAAFTITVMVNGGGIRGQAGAVRHGIARALLKYDENLRPTLRRGGYLSRDPRMKERKKPGLKRARKAPQYTKR
ncbi:MAG: 30S ribosomal protein S9 [Anaerolineae bacterium]